MTPDTDLALDDIQLGELSIWLRPDREDVIQVDPPQAYGIVQYAHTLAMLEREGWPRRALFPHGGNQMSIAIAGGFGLGELRSRRILPGNHVLRALGGLWGWELAELATQAFNLGDRLRSEVIVASRPPYEKAKARGRRP